MVEQKRENTMILEKKLYLSDKFVGHRTDNLGLVVLCLNNVTGPGSNGHPLAHDSLAGCLGLLLLNLIGVHTIQKVLKK